MLNTHSDHQLLPAASRRRQLFDGLATLIDTRYGGSVIRTTQLSANGALLQIAVVAANSGASLLWSNVSLHAPSFPVPALAFPVLPDDSFSSTHKSFHRLCRVTHHARHRYRGSESRPCSTSIPKPAISERGQIMPPFPTLWSAARDRQVARASTQIRSRLCRISGVTSCGITYVAANLHPRWANFPLQRVGEAT